MEVGQISYTPKSTSTPPSDMCAKWKKSTHGFPISTPETKCDQILKSMVGHLSGSKCIHPGRRIYTPKACVCEMKEIPPWVSEICSGNEIWAGGHPRRRHNTPPQLRRAGDKKGMTSKTCWWTAIEIYYDHWSTLLHHAEPMLFKCWASVGDGGPILKQHWPNV